MAAGRSALIKLLGGKTGNSIMLFEEAAPAGTKTTFHLHRDSDEVAYVLSDEISFKTGDERRSAVPAPAPSYYATSHMPGKTPASKLGRVLFLYTPAAAGGFFGGTVGAAGRIDQWSRGQ
jgi:hypothetical protein